MATSQTEQMCAIDTFWRNNPGAINSKGSMVHFPGIDRQLPLNAIHPQGVNDPNESPPDDHSDAPPPDDHSYDPPLNDYLDPSLRDKSFLPVNHFLDWFTLAPVGQLGNEPLDQLNEPFNQLDNEPFDQLDNEPFDQLDNEPFDQLDNEPFYPLDNELFDQLNNGPFDRSENKSFGQSDNEPTAKPAPRQRGRPKGSVDTKKRAPRRSPSQIAHDKNKKSRH
ncbi:hypothetical protein BS50DRAFT_38225 [Corynespora cassiicola Philippines]|uniref:Uncharacterized protein n=1 Tax=Corynespora cassiicola Philippines TaxID=1448308 RepID=A0A2T2PCE9_CORCC|nr:hypothetical protein BS50DRAFT_38225 [Corynespora cassiicola Philippines]